MEQRVTAITLGVADIGRARAFYEALGWRGESPDGEVASRASATTFWGGYSGVFIDPDGHPWEVAHNPGWSLAEDGSVPLR